VVLDSANPEDVPISSRAGAEEALYRAYLADKGVFGRESATKRTDARRVLKEETGMTDEAVEGWALMLERDAGMRRRLEKKFGEWEGNQGQKEIAPTAWRAGEEDSEDGESSAGPGGPSRGAGRGRGRGRGGGGRGRGNVAGPTGDKDTEAARRRKEASKGSRANHNRRDQRARKMARGGFPG
jgi:activating signal cointegrator complex subunit 2